LFQEFTQNSAAEMLNRRRISVLTAISHRLVVEPLFVVGQGSGGALFSESKK